MRASAEFEEGGEVRVEVAKLVVVRISDCYEGS